MRKLSLACGIFHRSDHPMLRWTTPSQVVQPPWRLCEMALILYRSSSVLVTSATTISFLSLRVALDQNRGASPHPSPVLPAWTLPTISWCCSLETAWFTSASAFHFWPVRTLALAFRTVWSVDSLSSRTSLAFSCTPRLWTALAAAMRFFQRVLLQKGIVVVPTTS